MCSFRCISVCCLLVMTGSVAAQDDTEPKVRGRTASEWIVVLRTAKEANQRRAGVIALGILGPKQLDVVPSLAKAVSDEDELVRLSAVQTLSGMEQDARGAVEAMSRAAVNDKSTQVREAACKALGKLGTVGQAAGSSLLKALADPDSRTRAAAAVALADVKADPAAAVPALSKALDDKERLVRLSAATALGRIDAAAKSAPRLATVLRLDADPEVRRLAAQALLQFGTGAAPVCGALLESADKEKAPAIRQVVLASLGLLDSEAKRTGPAFLLALKDDDARCRVMAVRGLGRQSARFEPALPGMIDSLKDDAIEVRLAATQELAQSGADPSRILPALKTAAKSDPRSVVREAAAEAVKKIEMTKP
jgi:HEAT repeat protein